MRFSHPVSSLLLAGLAASTTPAAAAAPDPHDLAGVWWNQAAPPRLAPLDRSALPFTAEGRARYDKTVAGLKDGSIVDQAVRLCLPEGMPRAMTSAYPFQIMMTPGQVTFVHEANPFYRTVRISDTHADPEEWDPSYMGEGIARWQGDTLVVDSTNFKSEKIYLDGSGLPASDRLHLVEHIKLLGGGKQLEELITVDDPVIFTHPWTARIRFERRPDIALKTDNVCGEPHRDLAALRKVATSPAKPAPAARKAVAELSANQLAFNNYWRGPSYAGPPGGPARTGGAAPGTGPMAAVAALMQPWAAAQFARLQAIEKSGRFFSTPTNRCIPAVVPGIGVPMQTQILVEPGFVTFLYELNRTVRIVRIDQSHPVPPAQSWLGNSVGHWEGDTLLIDTIGFNDKNVLANAVPMSAQMHIVQKLRMVDGKLEEHTTFDDPGALTAVFEKAVTYRPGSVFQEFACAENNQNGGVPTSSGEPTPYTLPRAATAADGAATTTP